MIGSIVTIVIVIRIDVGLVFIVAAALTAVLPVIAVFFVRYR